VRNAADVYRFFVSPYHPDVLRQPEVHAVVDPEARLRQALTWNVFRTLEQINPAFWMRPLIARLGGLTDEYASAPHVCQIACWDWLEPAPEARLRRYRRAAVRADVVIDTDDTLVTLLVPRVDEITTLVLSDTAEGGLLDLAEATSFKGGVRASYVGVVLPNGADSDVWVSRITRRALAVQRVLLASGRTVRNLRGIGALGWHDVLAILNDAARSTSLCPTERTCARDVGGWMSERLASRTAIREPVTQ
jgi:hypothetical protein